jgi:hypothetical protein
MVDLCTVVAHSIEDRYEQKSKNHSEKGFANLAPPPF